MQGSCAAGEEPCCGIPKTKPFFANWKATNGGNLHMASKPLFLEHTSQDAFGGLWQRRGPIYGKSVFHRAKAEGTGNGQSPGLSLIYTFETDLCTECLPLQIHPHISMATGEFWKVSPSPSCRHCPHYPHPALRILRPSPGQQIDPVLNSQGPRAILLIILTQLV